MGEHALSCQELVELITSYLEGLLPVDERLRFEQHLAGCRNCQAYLEQVHETMRLVGMLAVDAIPRHQREVLLRTFRNWKQR